LGTLFFIFVFGDLKDKASFQIGEVSINHLHFIIVMYVRLFTTHLKIC
jgi:hypothetical protein